MMQSRRVVVTGLGALTPLGNNVNEFWNNLINGKSGSAPITRFDTTKFKTRFAYVEQGAKKQGRNLSELSLEEMDALWNEAKKIT